MLLGRHTPVVQEYSPHLLYAIPRATARLTLGLHEPLPFHGVDLWHAYEMSWLDHAGKPTVWVGRNTYFSAIIIFTLASLGCGFSESLNELLEYTDEPFADSSALLVNILSKFTRKHVTVALSGDAGDELFAGYNKHYGEWQMRNGSWQANVIHLLQPVWQSLPKSRGGGIANKIRQLERFSNGMDLTPAERWWRWCCINDLDFVDKLLNDKVDASMAEIIETRQYFSSKVQFDGTLNDDLLADVGMVLPYDMLVKVDRMSMRNSLEVRVPFLDYRIVEFAFSLPVSSKINGNIKKKIVQDAFREILPKELYNRPKKGFEVPLLQWFKTDLKDKILNDWLSDEYIKAQGIFNVETIQQLKLQMLSNNPGDVHAQIWALIVFQNFWRKYME